MINMVFDWSTNCQWIFSSWQSNSLGGLIFGCILTFIVCFISAGFGQIKKLYLQKFTNSHSSLKNVKIHNTLMFFSGYTVKMIIMLLMMSMNVWVNLMIILGTSLGYVIIQNIKRNRKASNFQLDS